MQKSDFKFPDCFSVANIIDQNVNVNVNVNVNAIKRFPPFAFQSFLGDIVESLSTKYEIQTCYSRNGQEIEAAVRWADVVWIEWVNH